MHRSTSSKLLKTLTCAVVTISTVSISETCVLAQIVPDNTLGTESSTVNSETNIGGVESTLIDGGAIRGPNLFHSFQEFSVGEGRSAYFSNFTGVQSIFSRVTGNNASQILGRLGVLGGADLFLINPNGIVFGSNATLDVKSSFVGTTAQSINFANGSQFSASPSQDTSALLSINVPTGLQFGSNPKGIEVLGNGQGTRISSELVDTTFGLRVPQDKTLGLIGGDLLIQGGTLKTSGGQIELGSVNGYSLVNLEPNSKGFSFSYTGASEFSDIRLLQQTTVDASGLGGGKINLQGGNILISDGSSIESSTLQAGRGETLSINSSGTLEITQAKVREEKSSGLFTNVISNATGSGGNIDIKTKRLIVNEGGQIFSGTFGAGTAGSISIVAQESVTLSGKLSELPQIRTGSSISTIVLPDATGSGGDITLETPFLTVQEGAAISSATLGVGEGGNIIIKAKSIDVNSTLPSGTPSSLSARSRASGDSGNLTLDTEKLVVRDSARVTVSSTGGGKAGNITINSRSTQLDRSGKILAENVSNQGGNIDLQARDSLNLRRNSQISATAGNNGDGGNVNINADALVALEDSNITANAFEGRGGNIQITTQGFFLSPDSDITASSQFGIDGNVNIQTFGLDIKNSITPSQNRLVTTEEVIAGSCLARRNVERGSFVITGTGGLPINPYSGIERWDNLTGIQPVKDEKAQSQESSLPPVNYDASEGLPRKWQPGDPIVEAQALIIKEDGRASLIASSPQPEISNTDSLVCHADQAKS